jgi:ABC-type multidrug transport system ATPase subunit
MQEDRLFPHMTVEETLSFSASLRLPPHKYKKKVEELLDLFDLKSCKNTLIGSAQVKGISGGQRKRVSVALELLQETPKALFLDEPTSGLDSFTSLKLLTVLKQMARDHNIILCCTLHLPSSEVVQLFDRIIVLREGGILKTQIRGIMMMIIDIS